MVMQINSMNTIREALSNWIPVKLATENGETVFRWLYTGHRKFAEPFFDETIQRCLPLPQNSKGYKSVSAVGMLPEWADEIDYVTPSAFIFHISRCGSTLLSQALSLDPGTISLSEVALFDSILRLPLGKFANDTVGVRELLTAAVKFYGARRDAESRLFIKTDCWHLMFYKQIRAAYPETPFIIVYRDPAPVLESNRRKKAMQSIPGLLEPALFGFSEKTDGFNHNDMMSIVLEKFYNCIIEMATTDNNTFLFNYDEGIPAMMHRIARLTNMDLDADKEKQIIDRTAYNAKFPGRKFVEENTPATSFFRLSELKDLYEQIDQLRIKAAGTTDFPHSLSSLP